MEIRDKVIVITGASMGIGAAAARLLTKHGAKLALVARSTDKISALADELKSQTETFAVTADMNSGRGWQSA